jgi:hypothetical protein
MGLKNAGAQFQRMMEWVLRDLDQADPYIDDILVGSTGATEEEVLENHERDLRQVLETLAEHKIFVDPRKSHLFLREVEFCGHVLREGRRSPAPGKLRAIQKWERPRTISQMRGFLGLTNYYSGYVRGYANLAAPLMDTLKVGREDGLAVGRGVGLFVTKVVVVVVFEKAIDKMLSILQSYRKGS